MKKTSILSVIFMLFTAITFISCNVEPIDPAVLDQVDTGNNGGNETSSGAFKVNFDGQTWKSNSTQAIVNSDYIAITAMHSNGSFFQLTIQESSVGTYNWSRFVDTNSLVMAYSPGNGQVAYVSLSDSYAETLEYDDYIDTAEIIISSINTSNKTISGTFKFTGLRYNATLTDTETKIFTKGEFTLPYTADTTSPSNNSFFCKLDGNDFIPTNVNGIKSSGLISLIGRRGNVENIGITLLEDITPGTYPLEGMRTGDNNIGQYNLDNSGSNGYTADPGTVTITTHDTSAKHIVGTFKFTGTSFFNANTFEITNGTFDIYYQ